MVELANNFKVLLQQITSISSSDVLPVESAAKNLLRSGDHIFLLSGLSSQLSDLSVEGGERGRLGSAGSRVRHDGNDGPRGTDPMRGVEHELSFQRSASLAKICTTNPSHDHPAQLDSIKQAQILQKDIRSKDNVIEMVKCEIKYGT